MRKVLFPFIGIIIISFSSYGQNVGIGTSTPAAKLDISSTNSGLLIPRVALSSTATAGPVTSPVSSMLVYNTATAGSGATAVTPGFYYWNGSAWLRLADQTVTGATGPTGAAGTNGANGAAGATGPTGAAGTNGAIGATGAAGTNGAAGITGPTGTKGATGSTGPTGAAGTNGATGSTGTAGANGATGSTGPTGTAGTNGTNGSNGATGSTGAAGTNGTNGAAGATGPTGAAGTNGTNGTNGAIGAAGPTGATGAGYYATSTTSLTISSSGSTPTITTQSGLAYVPGDRVRILNQTTPTNYMEGTVTSYSGTSMVVSITNSGGSGTFSSWYISETGNVGATGAAGTNGTNGTNGAAGATGPTGAAGTNGATGSTGSTGTAGTNGTNGSNGATGSTGAAGTNGTNGAAGATGPTGAAGTNGTNGAAGATGPTGAAGTNGTNGTAGATGPTGAAGTNGTNGAAGVTGPTGAAGTNGAIGATGAAGTNGAAGAAGPTGTKGATGSTGPTGAAGTNGSNGATGSTGAAGTNGTNGAAGATGPTGATGFLSSGSAAGNTPYWNGTSWVVNSSNIYNNGGNVGIGTTSPVSNFEVLGSNPSKNIITIENTSTTGYSSMDFLNSSGTLAATFGYANSGTGGIFTSNAYMNSYGNNFILITNSTTPDIYISGSNGNVGIGTGTPLSSMDIAGSLALGTYGGATAAPANGLIVSGNVGIGNSAPTSLLSVGSASQFQVNSSGNIVKLNNVTTSFPASQGAANSILTNDGSGNLSWSTSNVGTSLTQAVTVVTTATYTVASTDFMIVDDYTSNATHKFTFPAPSASNLGRMLVVRTVGGKACTITVDNSTNYFLGNNAQISGASSSVTTAGSGDVVGAQNIRFVCVGPIGGNYYWITW